MATRTISTRLAIEGEAEYRQALKNCNQDLRAMQSELAGLQREYRGSANSLEALTAKGNALNTMYGRQREKVQQTRNALENARTAQARYGEQLENCRMRLSATQAELERLRSSTGNTTQAQRALERQLGSLNRELRQAEASEEAASRGVISWTRQNQNAQRDLNSLSRELQQNRRYMEEARSSTDGLSRSIDGYGRETRGAVAAARRFGAESAAAVDALADALEASGMIAAADKMKETLAAGAESAMQYEKGMAEVFTLLPGLSDDAYRQLSDDMLKFSGDMTVLTADSVPALYSAISAGVDVDNVFAFLTTAQKSAIGGVTDLKTAVDSLTSIVNAYGESNLTAQQAADMMFTAVRLGKTNFGELSASIYDVIPTAAAAKIGFDNVAAALAALTNRGIPAATATAQLRQMLLELSSTTQGAGMVFEKIAGRSFKAFLAEGGNVQQALQKLKQYALESGMGIDELFSSFESGNAALALTGPAAESFTRALSEMGDSTGAVDAAYETMTETAEYAAQRVQVAMENVKTAIGTALLPAFLSLADGAADGLGWAAGFLETNPWLVQAIAALTVGVTTLTASLSAAKAVLTLFQFAMNQIPLVGVVSAIGAVTAALVVFVSSAENAETKAAALSESLNESQRAYEESQGKLRQNNENLMGMAGALEALATVEHKSAAEKDAMLSLVNELNDAVPNLSLAYDEQTDSLNLTAEAIRQIAMSEADRAGQAAALERLKELYVAQAEIEEQLREATAALTETEAERGEKAKQYQNAMGPSMTQARDMAGALDTEKQAVAELTNMQRNLKEQIAEMQAQYHEYGVSLGTVTKKGKDQEEQDRKTANTAKDLRAETKVLIAAEDELSKAFREQQESGEISLDTALKLIDAGKLNMVIIDDETGALKFNTAAYIESYNKKIDGQINSLNARKAINDTALALKGEAIMAMEVAKSYVTADAARKGLTLDNAAVSAQIAELEKLKKSINTTAKETKKPAPTTRRAPAAVKTQAEKDLEAFKKLKDSLDHEKAMGEKSAEEYYQKLAEYRDRYLTSESNIEANRSVTESIYAYEQELLDEQLKHYETHLNEMASAAADALEEIQKNYDDVLARQEDMKNKLADYGGLFTVKDNEMTVNSLRDQMAALNTYRETLSELRDSGVSDGLLNEITGMGVDDAILYGKQLLEMEDGLADYNNAWEEKQNLAKEISETFYKTELETLESEYQSKLAEALDTLKNTSFQCGENTVQGLIDGMEKREDAVYTKAQKIAKKVAETLAAAFRVMEEEPDSDLKERKTTGSHLGGLLSVPFDGYVAELHKGERVLTNSEAAAYAAAAMPSSMEAPVQQIDRSQTAVLVNAIGTLMSGMERSGSSGDLIVTVPVNGTELARATIRDFRSVGEQSPKGGSDFI